MEHVKSIICELGDFEGNSLYMKRDDLIPISFGGNKARKALNFFKEIDAREYDCVVTYGSSSSNHCRIISNMAASRGMQCFIIGPKEASIPTFNREMMDLFHADIEVVPVDEVHETIERKLSELRRSGKTPYFIAGGGHGNLGTQAYVDCYDEIWGFEKENAMSFDYIFFASGTGTTQAGLVCGQLIHGDKRNIIGISIARKNPRGRDVVIESIKKYLSSKGYGFGTDEIEKNTIFIDEYVGYGYAHDNQEIDIVIEEALIRYGVPLDPTYTGKAFSGMKNFLEQKGIKGKNILFIHTGGTPLFFDYLKSKNERDVL